MTRTTINENALSGLFSATLYSCFSHIARYVPSVTGQISSKSVRPCLNIFCDTGSKVMQRYKISITVTNRSTGPSSCIDIAAQALGSTLMEKFL